jgi:hypothetical protein
MNRRNFVAGAAGASLFAPLALDAQTPTPAPNGKKPMFLELRKIQLRNTTDNQRGRATEFVNEIFAPAISKAGAITVGQFSPIVAADSPFILVLSSYSSLDAYDQALTRVWSDEGYLKAAARATSGPLLFERMEVGLLRGFPSFPGIEVQPADASKPARLFEMRTYESNSMLSLKKKIKMFGDGEIDIFRKYGMAPIFFGEQIAGGRMPNLTYMVAFDNVTAREACWRGFGGSPEWKKLSSTPGLSDGEVVSNISNMLLSPLAGSQVR